MSYQTTSPTKQKAIDHDRLFKELISTFFIEFIELFFPEVGSYFDPDSVTFLDKEVFTDITIGDRHEADLIAKVKFTQDYQHHGHTAAYFLIHIEAQNSVQADFNRRMFKYFARFHEKFLVPIYPIVIFSYDEPQTAATSSYQVSFPDFNVLNFSYRTIQLNKLHWRDFVNVPNPVASALMAKMNIDPEQRPKVKVEALRLLVTLKLNPAKMKLISGFFDSYLRLNAMEEAIFDKEINSLDKPIKEEAMEIITSWMERGIERGLEQGLEQGTRQGSLDRARRSVLLILQTKFSGIPDTIIEKINTITDIDTLEHLLSQTVNCCTLADFCNLPELTRETASVATTK